jgi:hypothetical protein
MFPLELPARSIDEVMRAVRALGKHRYVAGRTHLVHAFAFDAVGFAGETVPELLPAIEWARGILADPTVEIDSRDPRLWRSSSDDEVALVLDGFWRPGVPADLASMHLIGRLSALGLEVPSGEPFDERSEDDMHPLLIDAGWELLPLAKLDPERHAGAIAAFAEPIDFDVARFEEENAYEPIATLQELPAMGAAELLRGVDGDGRLADPLTVWAQGNRTYHDYVLRGVARAAKLTSS